jgi:hypothetical protein
VGSIDMSLRYNACRSKVSEKWTRFEAGQREIEKLYKELMRTFRGPEADKITLTLLRQLFNNLIVNLKGRRELLLDIQKLEQKWGRLPTTY